MVYFKRTNKNNFTYIYINMNLLTAPIRELTKQFVDLGYHLLTASVLDEEGDLSQVITLRNLLNTLLIRLGYTSVQAHTKAKAFVGKWQALCASAKQDCLAAYSGDPAASDEREIMLAYPGVFALEVYRMAHVLAQLKIKYVPRQMTEYAHSVTGIDIHPDCAIGKALFIDHGTGVVIGQTAIIGNHVRIYQGVTLGALSLGRGHTLRGTKRHPTIGDNVIIYANATILGGQTIVGNNCTIGANAFVTTSVNEGSVVTPLGGGVKVVSK